MTAKPTVDPTPHDRSSHWLEHAPAPMATVEGATHIVRYANPAFCRLMGKTKDELVGKPFCEMVPERDESLTLLDSVYRTGRTEAHPKQERSGQTTAFSAYTMWPIMADESVAGVVMQMTEAVPLHERTLAMNEALMLGSVRQHELAEAADSSNVILQAEIVDRKQREHDAQMLTNEISHRIKNNLQIIVALIAYEARRTAAACVPGYEAMQTRITAIAELYDLISQSSRGQAVAIDAYLKEIARTMSASLLAETSGIAIEVKAEALDIDPNRAVPFGLLVNELTTNSIKHAFPGGTGHIVLSIERIGDEIELTVADDGVGMKVKDPAIPREKHGADYVAIFVRQLGGTIAISGSAGAGTTARIRFPLLVLPPEGKP